MASEDSAPVAFSEDLDDSDDSGDQGQETNKNIISQMSSHAAQAAAWL